jgi:hypothetical protein
MASIRLGDKTIADARYVCPCSKVVIINQRHDGGRPMNKHELPVCKAFVEMDADAYEAMVRKDGIDRSAA